MSSKKKKVDLTDDEIFERAYLLFRKNENDRALSLISKVNNFEHRFMELKAQVLYKAERYKESLNLLELLHNNDDEFADVRKANYYAAGSFVHENLTMSDDVDTPDESYERLYNRACFLIAKFLYNEAAKLLDKALIKCREVLTEDGLTEAEIQKELSLILAQKAYVLVKMGLEKEAIKIYKCLQTSNLCDANVKIVVCNNLLILEKSFSNQTELLKGRFELYKALQNKRYKLSKIQRNGIKSNLSLLKSKKLENFLPTEANKEAFQEIVTGKLFKRKRVRKPLLPKNYDPNVPPDPERWLPRQERSSYKKKLNKKYKDRDIGRGTQGSNTFTNTQFPNTLNNAEIIKPSSSVEQSPKPGNEGSRQQRMIASKKNKKRKGGKW